MMNETVQHGCVRNAIPDFEKFMKFMEGGSKGQTCEQEIAKSREIHSRQDKRDPQRTRQSVRGPISRRRSRRMRHGDTFNPPSYISWYW